MNIDCQISKYKKLYIYNAKVSYPITYSMGKHKVSDKLGYKRFSKKIAKNIEEYVSIFDNRDYLSLDKYTYIYPSEADIKTCAFCLKAEPFVSFKNKPHVIPEFLGNKYLLHYDECDQCNSKFGGTIERELSEYLRPHRVFSKIKNKEGKYVSSYSISRDNFFKFSKEKDSYVIQGHDNLNLDFENKEFTYIFEIPKHTPINVYKGFMKIFYGLLPREHRVNFGFIREFLIDDKLNEVSNNIPIKVISTFTPYDNMKSPYLSILHRSGNISPSRVTQENFFEYVGIIYFGNTVFEVPMYCNKDIEKVLNKREMSLKLVPKPYGSFRRKIEDLNGSDRVVSEYPLNFGYNSINIID